MAIRCHVADLKFTEESFPSVKDLIDFSSNRSIEAEIEMGEEEEEHPDTSLVHYMVAFKRPWG